MKKCNSLEEVRNAIDELDTKLVDLISERSHLIRQAAAFKQSVEEVKAEEGDAKCGDGKCGDGK